MWCNFVFYIVQQLVERVLQTSSVVMAGSVYLSLGCVITSEIAVMGQMNLHLVVSGPHSFYCWSIQKKKMQILVYFIFLLLIRGYNQNMQSEPVHLYQWQLHPSVTGL